MDLFSSEKGNQTVFVRNISKPTYSYCCFCTPVELDESFKRILNGIPSCVGHRRYSKFDYLISDTHFFFLISVLKLTLVWRASSAIGCPLRIVHLLDTFTLFRVILIIVKKTTHNSYRIVFV